MRIDMHIHTSASDGTWTQEQLVKEVKNKGIQIFALTDHDTVDNISPTRALAKEAGLFFLPGIEISSTLHGHLFHILAYGINPLDTNLQQLIKENTRLMHEKDDDSINTLIEHGYKIDYERYLNYENDISRGGWKALNFLIEEGICRDTSEFFGGTFNELLNQAFPTFSLPEKVIEIIVGAGGIPVLAHPGVTLYNKYSLEELLEEFYNRGIQGIETFHPQHDEETSKTCYEWALQKDLQITGGSDCHGDFIHYRKLGVPEIYVSQLKVDKILSPAIDLLDIM
jgi:predicted metal-dependent phosphoesterase TrpH